MKYCVLLRDLISEMAVLQEKSVSKYVRRNQMANINGMKKFQNIFFKYTSKY